MRSSSRSSPTRRCVIQAGASLAGLALPGVLRLARAAQEAEILMRSDPQGARVGFDPVGLLVEPGATVRWTIEANVHTATAYHPDNDDHSLRIPQAAAPWDSGYLVEPGASFAVTLTVPGVYDYFCAPHELGGMVGRIIVGAPRGGPGTRPFDYFANDPAKAHWQAVPDAAQRVFPSVKDIVARGRIPLPALSGHG